MQNNVLHILEAAQKKEQKLLAVLLDPDFSANQNTNATIKQAIEGEADLFFVGGSLMTAGSTDVCIQKIKEKTQKPVILFPGSVLQLSGEADALFFLSLISGRNPELLIGQHVIAAPMLKQMKHLEVIPTAYMLVDGGRPTTVSYISQTTPIPRNKPEIAACTALAGQFLGLRLIYLDAGSGADFEVPAEMITAIRAQVDLPIVVGGGINTSEKAYLAAKAGADVVVVGTAFEKNANLVKEMATAVHSCNRSIV